MPSSIYRVEVNFVLRAERDERQLAPFWGAAVHLSALDMRSRPRVATQWLDKILETLHLHRDLFVEELERAIAAELGTRETVARLGPVIGPGQTHILRPPGYVEKDKSGRD